MSVDDPPSRLARHLSTGDAVVIGLGAMLGAGVFVSFAPAARAAGGALLLGLALAGSVAYANAIASAELAARYPASGGTYVYARACLGRAWGVLAGGAFIAGKLASCGAMALTVAVHVAPSLARPLAATTVVLLTALTSVGVQKTVQLTRVIVAVVAVTLALVIVVVATSDAADAARLWSDRGGSPTTAWGVLEAAGYLFFAFAGYARLATLGEEVREPSRIIPRAIRIALAITLCIYLLIAIALLAVLTPAEIGASSAPLVAAVERAGALGLAPLVRGGAAIAALGVLLSLLAGVGRTAFAMAANHELPRALAVVHPRHRVPQRAQLAVGACVLAIVLVADARAAIRFSSTCVLVYYAVTNLCAWTLPGPGRITRRALAAGGLAGCATLAVALLRW